jgi:multidrug efflux pump subunit AcrA (membrane-fusion protein)
MQMPPAPVKVERLQSAALEDSSNFVGTLDSAAGVTLQPESDGRVVQIFVSSGDRVSAGDPIMQLSSERSQADYRTVAESALSSGQQEIAALAASVDQAAATLAQANANASAIQQDLLDKTVTAPNDGIVGDIPIKLGDYVTAGSALATITQNQNLDVEIAVPTEEANRLRTGMSVELMPFGQDQAIATGNIRFVSPVTDATTQTVLAKARFSTPRQPLQDDQRLEVRVIWDERPGILVPTTAISRLGGQTFVFVPGEPDPPAAEGTTEGQPAQPNSAPAGPADGPPPLVARLKPVTLGELQGNDYQVLEGLSAGDTVITSGLLNLRDGVPIALDSSSENSPGAAPSAE